MAGTTFEDIGGVATLMAMLDLYWAFSTPIDNFKVELDHKIHITPSFFIFFECSWACWKGYKA